MIWWVIGMPVLWIRRFWCWLGVHDDLERISAMHPSKFCARCGERITS